MKSLLIALLVISLLVLTACENVKWVKIDEVDEKITVEVSDEDIEEEAEKIVDEILDLIGGDEEEEETDETLTKTEEDRVDVKTGFDSAEIKGTIGGVYHSFTTPYDDKDAIIFDIAKEWGIKVKDARLYVYFNGKAYSKKALDQKAEEEAKELEKDIENFDPETITYFQEFDSGIVRGIGCDFERKLLKIKFYNEFEEELPMYRSVIPKIKGALVVYFNNKVIILHCVDSIAPEQEVECIKANIQFAAAKQSTVINEDASFDLIDMLAIYRPGMNKQFAFKCLPKEE